jgi:multiple sugar transport system substrate-binding protein
MNFSNMKPFQLIVIGIFAFLIFLGLILFANFGGFGNASAKIGTVTIWGTLPPSNMEKVLGALRTSDQAYQEVSYVQKNEGTFDIDLAEAIASGNGPDLILISQEELDTEQSKLSVIPFSAISQRTFLNTFLPIDEIFLASNGTYGIPFVVDPLVMYYNRSILTSAGIVSPPTTWEGITSLAEQLTQSSAGTVSQSTVPFGVYDNVENARALVSLLFLQAGNPITSVGTNGIHANLNDAGANSTAVPASQSALSFYTQFADPARTVYSWNRAIPSARQAFLSGNLVFYPGFASELPFLKAANPNLDFDMTVIPQPQTSAQKVTFAKAYAFAIPKATKNAAGAETVALALGKASLAPTASQALNMAPATRASLAPSNSDRYSPIYYPQALIAKGWLSPSPAETDRIFSTMISSITSGRSAIGQALDAANQAINASL